MEGTRRKVVVVSNDERERSALYDLKRRLDDLDQLTSFKYVGRKGKDPAEAIFEVADRDLFDEKLAELRETKSVDLKVKL